MPTMTIRQAAGKIVIHADGNVIGESTRAIELIEGEREPAYYIPRADVAMALLEPSETRTTCPHKGEARYFSIITPSARMTDAVWSYETPLAGAEDIAGLLSFYTDRVVVERR
jgi:uncharacterized protein (DUF427 family)